MATKPRVSDVIARAGAALFMEKISIRIKHRSQLHQYDIIYYTLFNRCMTSQANHGNDDNAPMITEISVEGNLNLLVGRNSFTEETATAISQVIHSLCKQTIQLIWKAWTEIWIDAWQPHL